MQTVGQGTFGEVMLGLERHTREQVAVKVLEKDKITDDDARQRLMNEIAILHRVQHPNLLHLLEAVEELDCIFLVTEYVGGGELSSTADRVGVSIVGARMESTATWSLPRPQPCAGPNRNSDPDLTVILAVLLSLVQT